MRFIFLLLAFLGCTAALAKPDEGEILFAAAPAWAKASEPMPVPDDVRGMVFIRRQDFAAHLDSKGQTFFTAMLIHLVHPNSLQLGNVAFSWNPAAGKPIVHALRVHRNGTVRDVLATTKFEILRREDQLEAAMLDGTLTATLRVPDLRVGDELELSYSIPGQDPTLGKDSFGMLYLNDEPPPGRYTLSINWDDGQKPAYLPTPDLVANITQGPNSVVYAVDRPGPLKPPKDAPPRYGWQRVIQYSDFTSWQAISSRFSGMFRAASSVAPTGTVKQEAAAIAAAYKDPSDRAAAALKLVQQQVRYVYVGFSGGNYTPAAAEETWQRRYGDCKGKTVLLLALLRELDIPAEAVLVSNAGIDDGLNERLPSPAFFDHVLVRVRINDQTYWLDGTLPPVVTPAVDPIMPYRWVLPLSEAGSALERIEWVPAARPNAINLYEIDARGGFDKPALRRSTNIVRGPAAIAFYNQMSPLTDDQILSAVKRDLEGSEGWITINSATWRFDPASQSSIFEVSGTANFDWNAAGSKSRSLVLPGGGFYPPERRVRSSGSDSAVPFLNESEFTCHVTTVRLPTTTAPKDWSFNKGFFETYFGQAFLRTFERRGGEIRMVRSKRTLQQEIDPKTAVEDNLRIAKFDNSTAQIFHDPGSVDTLKAGMIVPATYELDWATDSKACLSPATAGSRK